METVITSRVGRCEGVNRLEVKVHCEDVSCVEHVYYLSQLQPALHNLVLPLMSREETHVCSPSGFPREPKVQQVPCWSEAR